MINIADILKDCPKGMELDCTYYSGEVTFEQVIDSDTYPIKINVKFGNEYFTHTLTEYGQVCKTPYNKCVIFPKGKTTWEGFQRPFKDGDVVVSKSESWIGIVKSYNDCDKTYDVYVAFENCWSRNYINIHVDIKLEFSRLATEEEKQKLFDAIKENGYQWDPETKTLYKPEFRDGDVCTGKVNGNLVIFIYKNRINTTLIKSHFTLVGACKNCYIYLKDEEIRFATEEEKQKLFDCIKANGYHWNDETKTLEILIKPKFKIGDRIRHKLTGNVYEVSSFLSNGYGSGVYEIGIINELVVKIIDIKEQDNYELLPDKFDITTLKPFDKVLVRNENGQKWMCDIFSYYDDKNPRYPFWGVGRSNSKQCIPYKGNEHLLGTTNDCDEFYKNW